MEFINNCPSWGLSLFKNPLYTLPKLKQAIHLVQKLYCCSEKIPISFNLEIQNPPKIVTSIKELFDNKSCVLQVKPVFLKSLSPQKTIKNVAEYYCSLCSNTFLVYSNVVYFNTIEEPVFCEAQKAYSQLPTTKTTLRVQEPEGPCNGSVFELVSEGFCDYQEGVLSDGVHEVPVVFLASVSNVLKVGQTIQVTGSLVSNWIKEPSVSQLTQLSYSFFAFHFSPVHQPFTRTGVNLLQVCLKGKNDFQKRQTIVRSAFPNVYGNYHVKLSLVLNLLSHLGGANMSTLVLGETGVGKSRLARYFSTLFPVKTLNGSQTYESCYQNNLKNLNTGEMEAGLLESRCLLNIDEFHMLRNMDKVYCAMENLSVVAYVTTFENTEKGGRDAKASAKHFQSHMWKGEKLYWSHDRFDIILKMFDYSGSRDFVSKTLSNSSMEDYDWLWDTKTISNYIQGLARPLQSITYNETVKEILNRFISFISSISLKRNREIISSPRLVYSIIKLCKAHALLLGDTEVTKENILFVILYFYLSSREFDQQISNVLVDEQAFLIEMQFLINEIENN